MSTLPYIQVAKDFEGLVIAVRELLEEGLNDGHAERLRENRDLLSEADRLIDPSPRSLSAGYYERALYLLDLEAELQRGRVSSDDLLADEINGLKAVDVGRRRFEEEHPQCGACGRRLATQFGRCPCTTERR